MALPAYYRVGNTKFLIVAAASFGLFPLYWFWRQWLAEREASGEVLSPFWRTLFSGLFAYSLFKRMRDRFAAEGQPPSFSPGVLAAAYLVLSLAWRLPAPWWLLAFVSFMPVYPIQVQINEAARRQDPEADLNEHWTPVTFLGICAGITLMLLAIIGTFAPKAP